MATFTVSDIGHANEIDGSHSGCSLCGNIDGPFVLVHNAVYKVNTEVGPVIADKPLQFCAPKLDTDGSVIRQGCVGTMALLVGFETPESRDDLTDRLEDALEEAAIQAAQIKALERTQVNVVPVDELMRLIDAAKR